MEHKFDYRWNLSEANFTKDKGKVFSCFACGGGSTMGYKLAGYDVIGCNEIDPRINKCYVTNHHPKYNFLCDIRELGKEKPLPKELYELDVLDGSPPCSSFSISGNREKDWGKVRKFKEGQKEQVLDTLFFDFIALAKELQPKVVVAENVRGLLMGSAKDYVRKIYHDFDDAGYICQHYLLQSAEMGVPQKRQRVFFVCIRKDLANLFMKQIDLFEQRPVLEMDFNEPPVLFGEIKDEEGQTINKAALETWKFRKYGDKKLEQCSKRGQNVRKFFNYYFLYDEKVAPPLAAHKECLVHFDVPKFTSTAEVNKISTFPLDYDYCGMSPHYICGMSVPPVMMAQIASQIWEQWLPKI